MPSILLFQPSNLPGKIVAAATGQPWAHAAIRHRNGSDQFRTEALAFRNSIMGRLDTKDSADRVVPVPWVEEIWTWEWCIRRWGICYGWRDIFRYPFRHSSRASYAGMTCSELVTRWLLDAEKDFPPPEQWERPLRELQSLGEPGEVSPGDLARILACIV